jgi:hypothetical protein
MRTGFAIISPGAVNLRLPMAKSIRAAETAVNNWYHHEKLRSIKNLTQLFGKAVDYGV